VAVLVHGLALGVLLTSLQGRSLLARLFLSPSTATTTGNPTDDVSLVQTVLLEPPELPPADSTPIPAGPTGAANRTVIDPSHPDPRALSDVPDPAASTAGGGAAGGPLEWSGRKDNLTLSRLLLSDVSQYLAARVRTADVARTWVYGAGALRTGTGFLAHGAWATQAIARSGFDQQAVTAGANGTRPSDRLLTPDADTDSGRDVPAAANDSEPRIASSAEPQRGDSEGESAPLADLGGPPSADPAIDEPGEGEDNVDVQSASDQPAVASLEATRPSAGGTTDGVAGPAIGPSPATVPRPAATGLSATTAAVPIGTSGVSGESGPRMQYLQTVYERVHELCDFPKPRALALDQGEVIVAFTIDPAGTVHDVRVVRSSGFQDFDGAAVSAVERAAPFAPVPSILGGGVDVRAPFDFQNPMVR
jgi:TonB family protein